jgi:hypothetical protein
MITLITLFLVPLFPGSLVHSLTRSFPVMLALHSNNGRIVK